MDSNLGDKKDLWNQIKQWSVGRTIIVLVIVAWVIKLNLIQHLDEKFLFTVLLIAVLLEIFQLLLNMFSNLQKWGEKIFYGFLMTVSVVGIISFSFIYLLRYL